MNRLLVILLLLLIQSCISHTDITSYDFRQVFDVSSDVELKIDPRGNIWLNDESRGCRFFSVDRGSGWYSTQSLFYPTGKSAYEYHRIYRINDSTALTIENGANQELNLSQTTNWGKTWNASSSISHLKEVQAEFHDHNGNIWLAGAGGRLFYSRSAGRRWQQFHIVLKKDENVTSLFWTDEWQGWIGTSANGLYRTSDGGRTWQKLLTPFDQFGSSPFVDTSISRQVSNIKIAGKNIFLAQKARVFYTERDKIQWQPLNDAVMIDVDTNSHTIFAVNKTAGLDVYTYQLSLKWRSKYALPYFPCKIKGSGNSLYFYALNEGRFGFVDQYNVQESGLFLLNKNISEPFRTVVVAGKKWGISRDGILGFSEKHNKWHRYAMAPPWAWDIGKYDDGNLLIKAEENERSYLFNIAKRSLSEYKLMNPLKDFFKATLVYFTVAQGEYNCFRSREESLSYKLNGQQFESRWSMVRETGSIKKVDTLQGRRYEKAIPVNRVTSFLQSLDDRFWTDTLSIQQLNFSSPDISLFDSTVKAIGAASTLPSQYNYLPVNGRYYMTSDIYFRDLSIFNGKFIVQNLNDSLFSVYLNRRFCSSTGARFLSMEFINDRGDVLRMEHKAYLNEDFTARFCNPWVLTMGDDIFRVNNASITEFFIETGAPVMLLDKAQLRVDFLLGIGSLLYNRKILIGE